MGTTEAVARPHLRAPARRMFGDLTLDVDRASVLVAGKRLQLTPREFELLAILVARHGAVVQRAELHAAMWSGELRRRDRSVDVLVRRIRIKLAAASPAWQYIHTHYGFGYRFEPERLPTSSHHA